MNIFNIKSTESTNQLLKELANRQYLKEGTVVVAEQQTAGRGQKGSIWESEPGKNITCSILLYPSFLPLSHRFLLSEAMALGVKKTLDCYLLRTEVKWPNDIYYNERKIAGILIENEMIDKKITRTIAGIGVNINQEVFTSDASNPVSTKQILKKELDLNKVLESMIKNILSWYDKLKAGRYCDIARAYTDSLYRKVGFHYYADKIGHFKARLQSVSNDGQLQLITENGERRSYAFKEIAYIM